MGTSLFLVQMSFDDVHEILLLCNLQYHPPTARCEGSDSSSSSAIPWRELSCLPELNPPNVMPRGNVGTPLSLFMDLIKSCKLPAQVIRKLRLEFPKSRSRKRYGAVGLDYGTSVVEGSTGVEIDCSPVGRRPDGRDERDGRDGRSVYQEAEEEEERIPSVGSNNKTYPY